MNWSKYQQAFFQELELSDRNVALIALAGSGKTVSITEGNNRFGRSTKILNVSFNKHIEIELRKRLPGFREVSTLNAAGWRLVRQNDKAATMDDDKNFKFLQSFFNYDNDEERKKFFKICGVIKRICSLFKQLGLFSFPSNWVSICDTYGIETGDFEEKDELPYYLEKVYSWSINDITKYDFADQLFQPIYRNMAFEKRDVLFVDEMQDLSPVQIEMIKRMGNRVVAVGDPHQAIYIFRGADLKAVDRIVNELDCVRMPLSICYRCPRAVIEAAKEYVPEIECAPDAVEGIVDYVSKGDYIKNVKDGDYVTCRNTAPLISACLQMLRERRRAFVRGRDIGDAIEQLIVKVKNRCGSDNLNVFLPALNDYHTAQTESLMRSGRETECELLNDKVQSIHAFAEDGAKTLTDVFNVMESVFSDKDQTGIEYSTIHKSKGREKQIVYRLRSDLCPNPKTKEHLLPIEYNLKYVEITRSQHSLFTIGK